MEGQDSHGDDLEAVNELQQETAYKDLTVEEKRRAFGNRLKAQRENLGQTERDIVHLTRISPPFIRALEEGQFDALPGEVFGRGFVKNICKVLEIESGPFLEAYNQCWEQKPVKSKGYKFGRKVGANTATTAHHKRKSKPALSKGAAALANYFSLQGVVFALAALLLVAGLAFVLAVKKPFQAATESGQGGEGSGGSQPQAAVKASEPAVAGPSSSDDEKPLLSTGLPEATASQPQDASLPPAVETAQEVVAKGLTLFPKGQDFAQVLVKVKEEVAIRYRLDQESYESVVYQPGYYRFKFKDKADFFIEETDKVELLFNDRPVGELTALDNKKHLSFIRQEHEKQLNM